MNVITALDGAPGTEIRMTPAEVKAADPGKLIIRLENRLSGLESLSSRSQSEIDQLTTEAAHARDDIAKPFPQALQLTAARDRVALLDEKAAARQPRRRSPPAATGWPRPPCTTPQSWPGCPDHP